MGDLKFLAMSELEERHDLVKKLLNADLSK